MRLRAIGMFLVVFFASLGTTPRAEAVPIASLDPSNLGIGTLATAFDPGTNTFVLVEDWTSVLQGSVLISGLDPGVDYTIVKQITNNSGTTWTRLANELLDPAGDENDTNSDPQPYPAFVPAGFSTSNDFDGLSFAQGSGLPRVSDKFASVFEDEFTDARDFLDFFNGTVLNGESLVVTYGLRDIPGTNQPFILFQRPNVESREPGVVPEPATMFLVGGGLAALVRRRLKRKQ